MAIDEKFVVIPVGDYIADKIDDGALTPGTYFVIKSADIFGSAALHGYAHILQTSLELDAIRPFIEPDEAVRLRELADALSTRATEWQAHSRKVPD